MTVSTATKVTQYHSKAPATVSKIEVLKISKFFHLDSFRLKLKFNRFILYISKAEGNRIALAKVADLW